MSTDRYYAGANWSNWAAENRLEDLGVIGDGRTYTGSSTDTLQLFEPGRLACIEGPYKTDGGESGVSATASILLPWAWGAGNFQMKYQVPTGNIQRLWHYRLASVKVFTRRGATGSDEPLLFVVMERYPFVPGTFYINDLPMTWVGITTTAGAIVKVLRPWQYGLYGPDSTLLTGNGHRLFWTCAYGAIMPQIRYLYTDLDSGAETTLSTDQLAQFLATRSRLLTPDFLWDRAAPEVFYDKSGLPGIAEDDALAGLANLLTVEDAPEGSVRVVNDEATLDPLDRYQAT